MKYRKKMLALCCLSMLGLVGCGPQSGLMNEYTDINILRSTDVQDAMPVYTVDPFAKNIAILTRDYTTAGTDESGGASTDGDSSENPDESGTVPDTSESVSETTAVPDGEDDGSGSGALSDTPALLVNYTTNEVIYSNRAFEEVAPASLTKMMTALVALKYGVMTDEVVTTTEMNADMVPSAQVCGLSPGDRIQLDPLIRAMLVYSGNDAANAIAVHISGSLSAFVDLMNIEANRIGAVNTHFSNTHGLDVENNYSSAYDLYLIFNECMKYDVFREAVQTYKYTLTYTTSGGEERVVSYDSTNQYLHGIAKSPEGITVYGGKTGTTENAGACLLVYAKDAEGVEYIALSMGNPDKEELYSQMNKILIKILN